MKKRKLFNILIISYVVSCLLVGGIIKSKAVNLGINDSLYVKCTCGLNGSSAFGGWQYNYQYDNSRLIIYNNPEFNDLIRENLENSGYATTGTVIFSRGTSIDYVPPNLNYGLSYINFSGYSFVNNYLSENGYNSNIIRNIQYIPSAYFIDSNNILSVNLDSDIKSEIGYVTNYDDLISYLSSGDDSIPSYSDPDNPPTDIDNALPVPQELSSTYKSGNNSYPPHLRGTWVNPDNASFNAIKSDIYIEVQYKPKFQFYASNSLFRKKYKVAESAEYLNIYNDKLEELYQFVKYGAEDGLYPSSNEFTINSSYLNDIRTAFSSDLQYINVLDSVIDVGSKWRARYYYYNSNGDKLSSYWAVYNVNQKNPIDSNKNSVTFQDSSGNPVNPEDVDYQNSTDTEDNNNLSLSNFFSNLSNSISNLFSTISGFFNYKDDSGNFLSFFSSVFKYFPQFLTLFLLGLVIVIMLRILGR